MRIALIDARRLTAAALAAWLSHVKRRSRVELFSSVLELRQGGSPQDFDVIVYARVGVDLERDRSAREVTALLREAGECPVVLVTDELDALLVDAVLRDGVRGIIPTYLDPPIATAAIELILAGGIFVPASSLLTPSSAVRSSGNGPGRSTGVVARASHLTGREQHVMRLLARGMPNKVIAYELGIRESTVKTHIHRLMTKMGARNRTELLRRMRDTATRSQD